MEVQSLTEEQVRTIVQQANDIYGDDNAVESYVYGSFYRPMSGVWARIPGARFLNADKSTTGMYTWVVTPAKLEGSVVESYELTFVYGPISTEKGASQC